MPKLPSVMLALCALVAPAAARAQPLPTEPLPIPASRRAAPLPAVPGTGARMMFVHGFFAGQPFHIDDARDLLEGRSITPSFERWCGNVPYVDFTNSIVRDSLGREGPTTLCLPFLGEAIPDAGISCQRLANLPTGTYHRGGGAAMRVRGYYAARQAGVVTFAWGHDDGFAFELAEVNVFEFPGPTGSRVDTQAVRFEAPGLYPFQLEWFDGIEGALIDWYFAEGDQRSEPFSSDAGSPFRLVPTHDLYPSDGVPCTPECGRCPVEARRCDYARSRCVACLDDGECPRCTVCIEGRCAGVGELPDGSVPSRNCGHAPVDAGPRPAVDDLDAGAAPTPRGVGGGCGCRAEGRCSTFPGALAAAMTALGAGARSRRRRAKRIGR